MLAFAMRLALELGKTLSELLESMNTAEFNLWFAYLGMTVEDFERLRPKRAEAGPPEPELEGQLRKMFGSVKRV